MHHPAIQQDEEITPESIRVFPNPAEDWINVEFNELITGNAVNDLTGRVANTKICTR